MSFRSASDFGVIGSGPMRTCMGRRGAFQHRWVMFEAADGDCPICKSMALIGELQTEAIKRHAEILPMNSVSVVPLDKPTSTESTLGAEDSGTETAASGAGGLAAARSSIKSWSVRPAPDGNAALVAYPSGTKQILQWAFCCGALGVALYCIAWALGYTR